MTKMEKDGATRGCFNMAKEDGIAACREYRAQLEAQGIKTSLKYFTGDLFIGECR